MLTLAIVIQLDRPNLFKIKILEEIQIIYNNNQIQIYLKF